MKQALKIAVALKQMSPDEGLSFSDIKEMMSRLSYGKVLTLSIDGENSCAEGFILQEYAECLDFCMDSLCSFVRNILDDVNNEREDGLYVFNEVVEEHIISFFVSLTY